ncbi:MAG: tripartite tricarboxylate transporter TctB family protein [Mailhella sp.]|nr:tripartite tricarboxylate transporter TctB family protein [Mailhella sp.]
MKKSAAFKQDMLGTALGVFCAVMLLLSPWQIDLDVPYPFYKGPLLMPLIALSMGTLASLPSMIRFFGSLRTGWKEESFAFPKKAFLLFIVAMLYPAAILFAGLEIATLVILSVELFINGVRNRLLLAGIPVAVTLIFWLVFRWLLDVFFPEPILYHLIMG